MFLPMGVLLVAMGGALVVPQADVVAWLNTHVHEFTDARVGVVRTGTAEWTGCDVTILSAVAIRDPKLRSAAGARGSVRIPLQQVSLVQRADSPTPTGLVSITLHRVDGVRWVSSGTGVDGSTAHDVVAHATLSVPAALAEEAEGKISALAVSCGAPLPRAKS
jgi:hypothetical protein